MTKLDKLFKEMESLLMGKSLYFDFEGKVVRLSNHEAEPFNFMKYNESANDVLLIFVGCDMCEIKAEKNAEKVSEYLNVECDYLICDNEQDVIFNKKMINRFLN